MLRYGTTRKYIYKDELLIFQVVWSGRDSLFTDTIFYEYDANNNLINHFIDLGDVSSTTVLKYDKNNLHIYDSSYQSNGTNEGTIISEFTNNQYGWKTNQTIRYPSNGRVLSMITWEYDESGKLILESEIDKIANITDKHFYGDIGLLDSLVTTMIFYSDSSEVKQTFYYEYRK